MAEIYGKVPVQYTLYLPPPEKKARGLLTLPRKDRVNGDKDNPRI
jgi:hypothetical protein